MCRMIRELTLDSRINQNPLVDEVYNDVSGMIVCPDVHVHPFNIYTDVIL